MRKLWVDKLDDSLLRLMDTFEVEHEPFARYERFGQLPPLIDSAIAAERSFDYSDLARKELKLVRSALEDLIAAKAKLTELDYDLIDLCHGEVLEGWSEAVIVSDYPVQQDKAPNEVATWIEKAYITPKLVLLDHYLRSKDSAVLDQLIEEFFKLPLLGSTISVRVSREKLDQQIELIWLKAAIKEIH